MAPLLVHGTPEGQLWREPPQELVWRRHRTPALGRVPGAQHRRHRSRRLTLSQGSLKQMGARPRGTAAVRAAA